MQVQQVAFDRFVLELPPADAEWRPLADAETIAEASAWLWEFGPTPLIAVVGVEGAAPDWLSSWSARPMKWAPEGMKASAAVVLNTVEDLQSFLKAGDPHDHTVLMWPRVAPAKTFEALNAGGNAWLGAVDAHAKMAQEGSRVEVIQVG
ncbi:MAG TPA: hypothetical protein VJQ09_09370 [Candidatus Limnocylindria bacterium]|nr:hypothetical protein [Candidatus Limnocylindria bacterium]